MKLDPKQTAFGRHETFPLRYAWLSKGFEALAERPDIFSTPDRAMVKLGVGRNMVSSIHYWLQAARLVEIADGQGRPTELGEVLLGDQGDRFLEDESTLWIIHWLIATNTRLATGFYWFFNRFALARFREDEVRASLSDFVERELHLERSQSTLKSDTSTLLRMYAPGRPGGKGRNEDHLDTPMGQLGLLGQTGQDREYLGARAARPFLPPLALHFALTECFDEEQQAEPALPIRDLLYGREDAAAPGAVFRLTEEGLMAALTRVMHTWSHHYELRDTAGIHQLYRIGPAVTPVSVLRDYYLGAAA